ARSRATAKECALVREARGRPRSKVRAPPHPDRNAPHHDPRVHGPAGGRLPRERERHGREARVMRVLRARGLAGARGARGTVVVIDVLRAFTTAAFAYASGARELALVATPDEALLRKVREPALVLVGEVGGRPIPGFDHGNSPERMQALDLAGRTVLLRSSSGVQGVFAARASARRVLLGSFVTAAAT